MKHIKKILLKRLEQNGVELENIPGFVRSCAHLYSHDPQIDLLYINQRLQYLGWDGVELDYHALQLLIACFEAEGLAIHETRSVNWFSRNFNAHILDADDHPDIPTEAAA